MGLLDEEVKGGYMPPKHFRKFPKQTALTDEARLSDLNNHDQEDNNKNHE